jgi:hypothetical protein
MECDVCVGLAEWASFTATARVKYRKVATKLTLFVLYAELRCYDAFGYEFWSSSLCARVIYALPLALDAVAVVGQRRGQPFLDFFGEVMTGVRPKSDFMQPLLLAEITVALVRQFVIQYVCRYEPLMPANIGLEIVRKQASGKQAAGAAASFTE